MIMLWKSLDTRQSGGLVSLLREPQFVQMGKGIVPLKSKISVLVRASSEREFETLLRETSQYLKVQKPRLVRKAEPVRRTPAA